MRKHSLVSPPIFAVVKWMIAVHDCHQSDGGYHPKIPLQYMKWETTNNRSTGYMNFDVIVLQSQALVEAKRLPPLIVEDPTTSGGAVEDVRYFDLEFH